MRPTMSCSKDVSTLPFLPQEILLQILIKLPAKSLVRFRCVSKFFCSLVVDHSFADLHRNWSLTLPSRMSILIFFPISCDRPCYYTINYPQENYGTLQANRLQYMDKQGKIFRNVYLRSAVNGLLCFCTYPGYRDDIVIHNLCTKHHISLPTPCSLPLKSGMRMNVCGLLGFDSVSRRYKVLKSVQFTDDRSRHISVTYWVFTLGVDKSWRGIHCYPSFQFHPYSCFAKKYVNDFYFRTTVHIDGVIYTLNSLNDDDYNQFHIIAFDVAAENFRTIPSPPWDDPPSYKITGLLEVEGRLAIAESHKSFAIVDSCKSCKSNLCYFMVLWILEEESMVWKKHMIPIPVTEICQLLFAPNHIGEIAVLAIFSKSASFLFYNFRRQSWRTFDLCEFFRPPSNDPFVLWSTAMHFIVDNVF